MFYLLLYVLVALGISQRLMDNRADARSASARSQASLGRAASAPDEGGMNRGKWVAETGDLAGFGGRSGGIRTHDPLTPSQVRYQAALRSVPKPYRQGLHRGNART